MTPTPPHTALREAQEEIGLAPGLVEVIGSLPTYTTGTSSSSRRWSRWCSPDYRLTLNAFEVADAFEVPLDFLMNPAHHRRHAHRLGAARGANGSPCPTWTARTERFVWGATAGMLRNFYRFLALRPERGPGGRIAPWQAPYHRSDELLRHPVRAADRAGASAGARTTRSTPALRGWARWVSRNFDAGKPHHGWVAWTLAVVVPSLAGAGGALGAGAHCWAGPSPCCGASPCCT